MVIPDYNTETMATRPSAEQARLLEQRLDRRTGALRRLSRRSAFWASTALAEFIVRLIELCVALFITIFLFVPVLLARLIIRRPTGKPVFESKTIFGHSGKPLRVLNFAGLSGWISRLPLFLELFTGRLALAGTTIREWQPVSPDAGQGYVSMVKPGIVSLWDIRKSSKIGHEGREATEWEYIFRKRPLYDFLLMLRALPVMLFAEHEVAESPVFQLLDQKIDNITMREAIGMMQESLRQKSQSVIFFVNPDCMNKSVTDQNYRKALRVADHLLPDGIGLVIAGKMLGTPLRENINGTDMLPWLCTMAVEENVSIFLVGGKPGIAEKAASALEQRYGVSIAGTAHGYFDHQSETGSHEVIETINNSKASILLVAFGAPLQERWIARHRNELHPKILMGVGGLFDFFSGNIKRAPRWIREIGLEWVYRLMQEPSRMWKRYVIGNPLFLYRVVKWKIVSRSFNR
ncbi:MAG: WecB/TagA/CpsF family glycosyltransferase [Chlorobiaceae bacterium]|nr:WecB/TagA/CpsF family glycosyltransferase [Chlorobiaceae bacterium]